MLPPSYAAIVQFSIERFRAGTVGKGGGVSHEEHHHIPASYGRKPPSQVEIDAINVSVGSLHNKCFRVYSSLLQSGGAT